MRQIPLDFILVVITERNFGVKLVKFGRIEHKMAAGYVTVSVSDTVCWLTSKKLATVGACKLYVIECD
jgi:hypothetical protein